MDNLNIDNIDNINNNEIKKRGRPRKYDINEPKKKYSYYIKTGVKQKGRPRKTEEELKNYKKLYNDNYKPRNKILVKIHYYKNKFTIPIELLNMPFKTDEELEQKYKHIYIYVKNNKIEYPNN